MSDLPRTVKLREVGPREGFQFEKGAIGLADKIALVDALTDTGVTTIEFTSFVSPKWVPQMADAEQLVAGIKRAPGVAYEAIWLNEAGLERAARLRDSLALRPMFSVAGTDTGVGFTEVARAAYMTRQLPPGMEPGFTETAAFTPPTVTFPNGCQVCEVEIDEATGVVRIVRHTVVDDVGRMVNPLLVKGQIHGGVVQGLGQALFEDLVYDANGQLLSGTLTDYAVPKASFLPSLELDRTETPSPVNPLGVKGAGETGTIASSAAVVNAVMDALRPFGIRHLDMPLTPPRILRALQETQGAKGGARR